MSSLRNAEIAAATRNPNPEIGWGIGMGKTPKDRRLEPGLSGGERHPPNDRLWRNHERAHTIQSRSDTAVMPG